MWGDIRKLEDVVQAVQDQEVIIHLAFVIPPRVDEDIEKARSVNVDGTHNLITAAQQLSSPPKILFASTLNVFGYTQKLPPPRTIDDPVVVTDAYTQHKLLGETAVKASGLEWAIFRFANVPPLETQQPHPIMFSIPLNTRFEVLHTYDAGLAIANGIKSDIWERTWLIGGGAQCQVRYRDYLRGAMKSVSIGELPEGAFGSDDYCTDWLDTSASEHLLHYQRHSFDEVMADLAKFTSPPAPIRLVLPLVAPLVRQQILKMSPYYKRTK